MAFGLDLTELWVFENTGGKFEGGGPRFFGPHSFSAVPSKRAVAPHLRPGLIACHTLNIPPKWRSLNIPKRVEFEAFSTIGDILQ